MTQYVALLRGIGPTNPNMHPNKLREAFAKMGFKNVRTVIASGNVVFETSKTNGVVLEEKIETALPKLLGFSVPAIVRSQDELEELVKKNPYKGIEHSKKQYTLVTFLKHHSTKLRTFPRESEGAKVVAVYKKELCSVYDNSTTRTVDAMRKLEREFGKDITSRTWKTVEKISKKMQEIESEQ